MLGEGLPVYRRKTDDWCGQWSDALEIALRSVGVGVGDEVITVSHTAVATIAAIVAVGATPIFVDIHEDYFTLAPEQLFSAMSKKTRAVVAVHIYGQSADIERIKTFCDSYNLWLIEDVSQAHGSDFNGAKLGTIGHIGCFSCYPTKNLGAIGDAGLITTNDSELADRMIMVREYGWVARESQINGRNSRLDEMQAAILRVKLRNLDMFNEDRRAVASVYDERLAGLPLKLPVRQPKSKHVFHLYVIQLEQREKLIEYLNERDIFPSIHYLKAAHQHPAFVNFVKNDTNLSVTEAVVPKILSLPMYPELGIARASQVADAIEAFFIDNKT